MRPNSKCIDCVNSRRRAQLICLHPTVADCYLQAGPSNFFLRNPMSATRPIHPDFLSFLRLKDPALIVLFEDARHFLLDIYPDANELLYRTHALTAVFSLSDRLGDAYCMLPIYASHVNLGFNRGTLLPDPHKLLTGTGNLIRHIDISVPADYRNQKVRDLVQSAIDFARADMDKPSRAVGLTISKITAKK